MSLRAVVVAVLLIVFIGNAQDLKPGGLGERQAIDLTIYNQNLSLVRELRFLSLEKGLGRVVIPDIPSTIDGTSLHFSSLTDPMSVRVLEQNYQYDLVHQGKLLEKYLGKQIEFVRFDPDTKKEYTVTGRLLATGFSSQPQGDAFSVSHIATGGMVAEIDGKIEINPAGRIVLPSLPEGLVLRPQLEWLVSSTRPGKHKTEISYLAGRLSWSCNYVALLSEDDESLDLTGWVTVTNNSGTSFKDAGLKLVAGDINIVREQFADAMTLGRSSLEQNGAKLQFAQRDLFEYKLYTLQRRTDIKNDETKQIELTSAKDAESKKVFIYDGLADQWRYWYNNYSYRSQGSFGQNSNPKVGVFVTFRNDLASGLGMPLPKGKVRVYKRDNEGKEQFIGEDQIDHTSKDEEVRLYLGNAFDIVGERVQKDFRSYGSGDIVEETIQIKVRNHKEEPVEVFVYEHPWRWSQWEIVKSTSEWEKVDQTTLRFPVKVLRDGEKVISYTVRYSW